MFVKRPIVWTKQATVVFPFLVQRTKQLWCHFLLIKHLRNLVTEMTWKNRSSWKIKAKSDCPEAAPEAPAAGIMCVIGGKESLFLRSALKCNFVLNL